MIPSPYYRAAIGVAATSFLVAQGCFVYRPTALPVATGSAVSVRGSSLAIYGGSLVLHATAECHASRIDGTLFNARNDTLTIAPVSALRVYTPPHTCLRLDSATLVAAPDATQVLVRHFSAWRTTGAVVGTAAVVSVIALAVTANAYAHSDPNMRPTGLLPARP